MSTNANIAALEADVDQLRARLQAAKDRLHDARLAECGVQIGSVVVAKGKRYLVTDVDPSWSTPWLKGRPEKVDGTWGNAIRNIFDKWERVA